MRIDNRYHLNILKTRLVALLLLSVFIFSSCASYTVIRSRPEGATVYIEDINQGKTPVIYSDTAIAGTVKQVVLKKDGYKPLNTVIRKDQFQVGPCICGVFFLFPFIWILGYPDNYQFDLEPEGDQVTQNMN